MQVEGIEARQARGVENIKRVRKVSHWCELSSDRVACIGSLDHAIEMKGSIYSILFF